MSEVKRKCKYKSSITGWECPYEALEDSKEGFCIFHERRKDKDIKKFNEGIKKMLEDKDADAYHFEGFFFPDSVSFRKFQFKKSVFFCNAEFLGETTDFMFASFSGEHTDFSRAKFSGKNTIFNWVEFSRGYTDFTGVKFSVKNIDFNRAKFLGEYTSFSRAEFSGENIDFGYTEFSAENTNFYRARFSGVNTDFIYAMFSGEYTNFARVEFSGGYTTFSYAEFSGGYTNFRGAGFSAENTEFSSVNFLSQRTVFFATRFLGKEVNLYDWKFFKNILFNRTIFKAKTSFIGVDLRNCVFLNVDLKNVDFTLLDWDWNYKLGNETELEQIIKEIIRPLIEKHKVKKKERRELYLNTSEIYRQLKVQFHNKRDFAKAGMFHFREQECKRMACKLPKDFFKLIFLWILKLSCGYGEKLRNVGLSSVALVLIFGIFYMFLGLHTTDQAESLIFQYKIGLKSTAPIWTIIKDFLTSVSFSIKGFFPLWRFQQYKLVGDFANLVAGIEFLLGAFFIGLFIYVFRRRMEK